MITHGFIFARGGSKGLPGKNIRPLNGKPLIQYSIEVAFKVSDIQQVFVSTDDAAIAEVALRCGAEVIKRPAELATDTCPEWMAWRHAVNYVSQHYGAFDRFVSLPPTSPLRAPNDVKAALELFNDNNPDVCISITASGRSPFFNMVKRSASGCVEVVNALEGRITRRQDAPAVFDITTVVYATTPTFILEKEGLFDGKVMGIEIPKERAVDIDDIYDFMLADAILRSGSEQYAK